MEYGQHLLHIEDKLDKQAEIVRDQIIGRGDDEKLLERLDHRVEKVRNAITHAYNDPIPETIEIATDMVDMFSTLSIEQLFSTMRRDSRNMYKQKASEERQAARVDALTQSNNRSVYHEQLKAATSDITKQEPEPDGKQRYFALVMFDLDRFKGINDDYGHDTGDAALQSFAQVLRNITRTHPDRRNDEHLESTDRRVDPDDMDTLFEPFGKKGQHGGEKSMSRLGGDEFTLLMNTRAESIEDATAQFEGGLNRLRSELEAVCFEYKGKNFPIVSSSGMHVLQEDDTAESAYVKADTALAEHKKDKKERYEKAVEILTGLGVQNLQVVEDKRKAELSSMKVEDVLASFKVLQERAALKIHVRPDQQMTPAAETLEEFGIPIVYDDEDDYEPPHDEPGVV
ncbi:MAG: GGDEF domain-containing protein [Alcanivorax sp.]